MRFSYTSYICHIVIYTFLYESVTLKSVAYYNALGLLSIACKPEVYQIFIPVSQLIKPLPILLSVYYLSVFISQKSKGN